MENVEEIWKDIEGYEGLYQISNYGRVLSVKRNIYLKGAINNCGYIKCYLNINNKQKTFLLHRLVGIAFIQNPENKSQINHINGDKTDNSVINLEWNTASENMSHSFKVLKRVHNRAMLGRYGINNHNSIKVDQYSKDDIFIKTWDCIMDIERVLNIYNTHISSCLTGKRKTTGGYIWKYHTNED